MNGPPGDDNAGVAAGVEVEVDQVEQVDRQNTTCAKERYRRAKLTFSHAAAAALANLPEAVAQVDAALAEMNAAREALRELETEERG